MAPSELQIKTSVVARLLKEEKYYHTEVSEHEQTIADMEKNNADEYEVRKMKEVLEDTRKMIPELQGKIKTSLESLKSYIQNTSEDTSEAQLVVSQAEEYLKEQEKSAE